MAMWGVVVGVCHQSRDDPIRSTHADRSHDVMSRDLGDAQTISPRSTRCLSFSNMDHPTRVEPKNGCDQHSDVGIGLGGWSGDLAVLL